MSTTPSFIFVGFPSTTDERFVGWRRFRESIAAGRRLDRAETGRAAEPGLITSPCVGIWRLLAPNNRELGRSWAAYPTFEAAREHVVRLRTVIEEIEISAIRGASSSQYGWIASHDGDPVISSGRWFGAPSTSLHSAVTALTAFETAVVSQEAWSGVRGATRGRGAPPASVEVEAQLAQQGRQPLLVER